MSEENAKKSNTDIDDLYAEAEEWHVNTGGQTIHAKRMGGRFRNLKWIANAFWLIFFLGPYLRLNGQQAVLFDIPNRQFHIFGITVLPQEFWMLSLLLLFFAILLAVVTALAGRVWCGYFCFQTVWVDVFTWVEEFFEGNPTQRKKADKTGFSMAKLKTKLPKHLVWLLISVLTGISFAAWFVDAFDLWRDLFTLQASSTAYIVLALFTVGTYGLAGFLREQTCFWLCPYARIQGVMIDATTILPTYDYARGEPRGRMKKGEAQGSKGDCVDCNQCVSVCPTGVDIRHGQQEGCITCALCIDACDAVMDKLKKPRGLIRYASLDEIQGKPVKAMLKRPRVWVYGSILLLAWVGIIYGLTSLSQLELKVLHERQPLYVQLSDRHIQNKYTLKLLNKLQYPVSVTISAEGPQGLQIVNAEKPVEVAASGVSPWTVYVKVPNENIAAENMPIMFRVSTLDDKGNLIETIRESVFIGPG